MSKEYYDWLRKHHKNEPYIKGRNFEYSCMRKLRKHGYYVVRKFGSKGHEDLVAFKTTYYDEPKTIVLMIQCKWSKNRNTKPTQFDLLGLIKLAERYGALAIFAGIRKHRMYFQKWNEQAEEWEDFELG